MKRLFLVLGILLFLGYQVNAKLRLPALVSDGMVLQRDQPVSIWGWADAGQEIRVKFNDRVLKTKTSLDGKWTLILPTSAAGSLASIVISTVNESISVNDILFGDVWLCSGQSNMELEMAKVASKYPEDIAASTNSNIREFRVSRKYNFSAELDDVEGNWKSANPTNVTKFSAAAYFMATTLYEKYRVPIGIIHSSWGGTRIESWISEQGLEGFSYFLKRAAYFKDPSKIELAAKKDKDKARNWYRQIKENDLGSNEPNTAWYTSNVDTSGWKKVRVPGFWETQGLPALDGVVWYRKEIDISAPATGKDAVLDLGMLDDQDSTYFNGTWIGSTRDRYTQRKYVIPATLIKKGKNIITVRIIDTDSNGGFIPEKQYQLTIGNEVINLSGTWNCKVGAVATPMASSSFTRFHVEPVGLFNAMIAPLTSYSIKGAAWYQGESNAGKAMDYQRLLTALIRDWRGRWGLGDFPFLVVQLPNHLESQTQPSEGNWALLREAQLLTSKTVPNVGLATTIDIGEAHDVHPLNKKDVGIRLALLAEKIAYKEPNLVSTGPLYQSFKINNQYVTLSFINAGGGLVAKDSKDVKYVSIAGADKKFVWAKTRIEGNKLIVWDERVPKPVAVRYAWADNPVGCNLFNKEGLPASPFRTDIPNN